jgi:DNA repair protein RadC
MTVREAITRYKKIGEIGNSKLDDPKAAYNYISTYMEEKGTFDFEKEHFFVIPLNRQNHPKKGLHVISIGHATSCLVHPREVLRPAIMENATAIIVAHNHPSGDPQPSPADIQTTRKLKAACDIMEISFLDHVIIGEPGADITGQGYYSFATAGLL